MMRVSLERLLRHFLVWSLSASTDHGPTPSNVWVLADVDQDSEDHSEADELGGRSTPEQALNKANSDTEEGWSGAQLAELTEFADEDERNFFKGNGAGEEGDAAGETDSSFVDKDISSDEEVVLPQETHTSPNDKDIACMTSDEEAEPWEVALPHQSPNDKDMTSDEEEEPLPYGWPEARSRTKLFYYCSFMSKSQWEKPLRAGNKGTINS